MKSYYRYSKTLYVIMNSDKGVQYVINSNEKPPVKRNKFNTRKDFEDQHELIKQLCGNPIKTR